MHLIVEAFRRAYMDRAAYLGDPDYNRIPVAELTSKNYADAWRASIDPYAATPAPRFSGPRAFYPRAQNRRPSHRIARHHPLFRGR